MEANDEIRDPAEIRESISDAEHQECKDANSGEEKSAYFLHDGYLCRSKQGRNGEEITIRLCNFEAEIVREDALDDGKDITLNFVIQGKLHGEHYQRVLAFVYRGENAIKLVRLIAGATNPEEAEPTTIRGAYGRITTKGVYENVIHASGDPEDAEREIKLWFEPQEIVNSLYPTEERSFTNLKKLVWK